MKRHTESGNELSRELWAWQFLRRNPEYQHDYADFIGRWRSLEADYGKAPNRDFPRWKNDPRAYVRQGDDRLSCGSVANACAVEEGKIMIECWMGAKWGFYKFPQDPDNACPDYPGELLWREQEREPSLLATGQEVSSTPHYATVQFDLRLSFDEQWDEAIKMLAAVRRERQRNQSLRTRIRDNVSLWQYCLAYLDSNGAELDESIQSEYPADFLAKEAARLVNGGYKTILMMRE